MRVLIIEENVSLRNLLKTRLPAHGFVVDVAPDGTSGIHFAQTGTYDLILLCIHLNDMTGEEVVERLRDMPVFSPILILTIVSDVSSKIRILDAGADDYLVKPFAFGELVARMRVLLRRSGKITPDVLTVGDIELDANRQTVRRACDHIALTRKEFSLLEYLMRNAGNVVEKTTLIECAWNNSADPFSSSLDTHLSNLRKKLGDPSLIRTVRGKGYAIE